MLQLRIKIYEAEGANKALVDEINERKNLERELIAVSELAAELSRAEEMFLANMSHEIRTPMNAILGMADLMAKTNLDDDQRLFINTIHSAADNLLMLINDILDLTKISAAKLNIESIGFNLKQAIERAMLVMMYRAEENGLLLTNSFFDLRISDILIGDPHRLKQVLLNLISNAVKFTDKGFIDVTCKLTEDNVDNQTIQIQITDTGIGMDEAFVKKMFQKFLQEDGSMSRKYGGTGLCMSICKEIVELMGGTIDVESKKGTGTTVTVTIKFQKGTKEQLPAKEVNNVDISILKGKRVLIVDDNEMNRLVACYMLTPYEVIIVEAENGKEAVEKIQAEPFDIILMDIQMPEMNGIEAVKVIRENISKALPVIALTAMALKGDDEKFLQAGLSDYVSKPFNEHQLLQALIRNLKAQPAESKTALYDLSKIHTIADDNEAFVEKMINLFLLQGPASVEEIKEAYQNKNIEQVKKVAHRLKPSIDNMGITSLREIIREIEAADATNPDSERLAELIQQLQTKMDEVVIDVKQNNTVLS